jgi:hypothetical protein
MKKILVFLTLFSSYSLIAQVTLTEIDFPNTGDTVRFSSTTISTNDPNTTGQSYTWDYSSLVADSQFVREFTSIGFSPVQVSFGLFAPTNYQASYFIPENALQLNQLGNFLPVTLSDARSYQRSLTDSITKVGFSIQVNGLDVAFPSDSIETKYKFPMTYGQDFNTVGYTVIDLNPATNLIIKQHRNVHSVVDGYGQLILPFGTFDVIRLKREIVELDSIYQSFFGAPGWFVPPVTTSYEYEWITQGKKDALLKIVTRDTGGQQQIQSIEYQDAYIDFAGIQENEVLTNIYPNPSIDKLTINCQGIIDGIQIHELNGKVVNRIDSVNSTNLDVDISNLDKGSYLVSVSTNKGFKTIRVTKN